MAELRESFVLKVFEKAGLSFFLTEATVKHVPEKNFAELCFLLRDIELCTSIFADLFSYGVQIQDDNCSVIVSPWGDTYGLTINCRIPLNGSFCFFEQFICIESSETIQEKAKVSMEYGIPGYQVMLPNFPSHSLFDDHNDNERDELNRCGIVFQLFGTVDFQTSQIDVQCFSPHHFELLKEIDFQAIRNQKKLGKMFALLQLLDQLKSNIAENCDALSSIVCQLNGICPIIAFERWENLLKRFKNTTELTDGDYDEMDDDEIQEYQRGQTNAYKKLTIQLLDNLLGGKQSQETEKLFLKKQAYLESFMEFDEIVSGCFQMAHYRSRTIAEMLDSVLKQNNSDDAQRIWNDLLSYNAEMSHEVNCRIKLLKSLLKSLSYSRNQYKRYNSNFHGISQEGLDLVESWICTINDPTEQAKLMVDFLALQ